MCNSCQMLNINGIPCHELGCPEAWRSEIRSCRECGTDFRPESPLQYDCSPECTSSYWGLDTYGDEIDSNEIEE